ncbi:hypothetical protein Ciccas_003146 [Cichlidogyrus casuarinus]|uniref:Uncharacterized protein n=1 Tax=Cichlidogyrus casuarinus TaxID=1844966 RepID=A0ABD2QF87_9PLAT
MLNKYIDAFFQRRFKFIIIYIGLRIDQHKNVSSFLKAGLDASSMRGPDSMVQASSAVDSFFFMIDT